MPILDRAPPLRSHVQWPIQVSTEVTRSAGDSTFMDLPSRVDGITRRGYSNKSHTNIDVMNRYRSLNMLQLDLSLRNRSRHCRSLGSSTHYALWRRLCSAANVPVGTRKASLLRMQWDMTLTSFQYSTGKKSTQHFSNATGHLELRVWPIADLGKHDSAKRCRHPRRPCVWQLQKPSITAIEPYLCDLRRIIALHVLRREK